MRKISIILACILLGSLFLVPIGYAKEPGKGPKKPVPMPQNLVMFGGSASGAMTDILCKAAQKHFQDTFPQMNTRLFPSQTLDGLIKVHKGEADFTISATGMAKDAYLGKYPTIKGYELTNVTQLMIVSTPNYAPVLVTLKDSPYKDIADLKNRPVRISLASKTGALQEFAWTGFSTHGIIEKSIKAAGGIVTYLEYDEGYDMLGSRKLDVVMSSGSHPVALLVTLNATRGIRLLSWSEEAIKAMNEKHLLMRNVMPPNTYAGQIEPVNTSAIAYTFFVRKGLSEDVVFNLVAALCKDDFTQLSDLKPAWKGFNFLASPIEPIGAPIHPGAIKYFKERGFPVPEFKP